MNTTYYDMPNIVEHLSKILESTGGQTISQMVDEIAKQAEEFDGEIEFEILQRGDVVLWGSYVEGDNINSAIWSSQEDMRSNGEAGDSFEYMQHSMDSIENAWIDWLEDNGISPDRLQIEFT